MRTVDRQGVHIEQCENCRGIFLDHGELEQMLTAEDHFYGASPYVPPGGLAGSPIHRARTVAASIPTRRARTGRARAYSDSPRPYGNRKHKSSSATCSAER